MVSELSDLLRRTVNRELPCLEALDDEASAIKPAGPKSWSPREELGHLIDSAINNHLRFASAALAPEFRGSKYAQNAWVDLHGYQNMSWKQIVHCWKAQNDLIAALLDNLPDHRLETLCIIGADPPVPLRFLIADYVLHMEHHIDHLLSRAVVTPYPVG